MRYFFRAIAGNAGGSALAIRDGADDEEQMLALFADSTCKDFVRFGNEHCLALSHAGELALVDLANRQVVKRRKHRFRPDTLVVASDLSQAIGYANGTVFVIDLEDLDYLAKYNLIQQRADGGFDLLHRDADILKKEETPWDSIPCSDGPLRDEIMSEDSPWLRYAPEKPSGLRRMRFSRHVRGVFRADGKLVLPFEFFKRTGPSWVSDPRPKKPSVQKTSVISNGVAVLDLNDQTAQFHVLASHVENKVDSDFYVRSFSPDGLTAILPAYEPVKLPSSSPAPAGRGLARAVFGRKNMGHESANYAFALEVWDISETPERQCVIPYRAVSQDSLLQIDTQRLLDDRRNAAAKEIDLIQAGIAANFSDAMEYWRTSAERRNEDAYFAPFESVPADKTSYKLVHAPALFPEAIKRLMRLHPQPFSSFNWKQAEPRQCKLFVGMLNAWAKHSLHGTDAIIWSSNERFVALSRGGTLREISTKGTVGPVCQLVPPDGGEWAYWRGYMLSLALEQYSQSSFEVQIFAMAPAGDCLRVELLDAPLSNMRAGEPVMPLRYSFLREYDLDDKKRVLSKVDRLTDKIRRGHIKIKDRNAASIIAGLAELSDEVTAYFDEIVVGNRWVPALQYRGKPVIEDEFCKILLVDGSVDAIAALDGFLTTYLSVMQTRQENVWHHDDLKPTMGPVTMALIQMCDPIPQSVMQFYARRDMDHDMWTQDVFEKLPLTDERLLSPDLVTLQIRLAIQDIATQNMDPDIFALYRLPLLREALQADANMVPILTELIVSQTQAQSPNFTWSSGDGIPGVLEAIADQLYRNHDAEQALAGELGAKAKQIRIEEARKAAQEEERRKAEQEAERKEN